MGWHAAVDSTSSKLGLPAVYLGTWSARAADSFQALSLSPRSGRSLPDRCIIKGASFGIVKPSGRVYSSCQPRNDIDEKKKDGQSNKAHRAHAQFSVLVCFFLSVVLWRSAKLGQRNQRLGVFFFLASATVKRSFPSSALPILVTCYLSVCCCSLAEEVPRLCATLERP